MLCFYGTFEVIYPLFKEINFFVSSLAVFFSVRLRLRDRLLYIFGAAILKDLSPIFVYFSWI